MEERGVGKAGGGEVGETEKERNLYLVVWKKKNYKWKKFTAKFEKKQVQSPLQFVSTPPIMKTKWGKVVESVSFSHKEGQVWNDDR